MHDLVNDFINISLDGFGLGNMGFLFYQMIEFLLILKTFLSFIGYEYKIIGGLFFLKTV